MATSNGNGSNGWPASINLFPQGLPPTSATAPPNAAAAAITASASPPPAAVPMSPPILSIVPNATNVPLSPGNIPSAAYRAAIWMIVNDPRHKTKDGRARAIFNFVWTREAADGGVWIRSKDPEGTYLLTARTNRLIEISTRSEDFGAFIHWKYGLNPADGLTRYILHNVHTWTRYQGITRELKRFTHYNSKAKKLYVSRYNGTCYELDGDNYDVVQNGTGCLFLDDDGGITEEDDVIVGPNGYLFPHLVDNLNYVAHTDGGMTPEQQKFAFTVWIFAIAFADIMETKPLLLVEGAPGSGKTSAVRMIKYALHGYSKPMTVKQSGDGEKDFYVQLLTTPIALLDNVDNFVKWLQDAVCGYVTGAEDRKRKLYTDSATVVIKPQAFIAIASQNPTTFRRPDVADRSILIRLERREDNKSVKHLFDEIKKHRPEILGEWLYYLNMIVKELQNTANDGRRHVHRMAEFANIAHIIGKILGHDEQFVEGMLDAMQSERESFSAENDAVVDLIDKWLETTVNATRELSAADLHRELMTVAKTQNREYKGSPASLAHRLSRDVAIAKMFKIQTRLHPKTNTRMYKIKRDD